MRICLIDDAGFGQTDTFVGPISTPNLTRVQKMGLTYSRLRHRGLLADPGRVGHWPEQPPRRFGSIAEYPGPFPGYTASRPRTCTALPRT